MVYVVDVVAELIVQLLTGTHRDTQIAVSYGTTSQARMVQHLTADVRNTCHKMKIPNDCFHVSYCHEHISTT